MDKEGNAKDFSLILVNIWEYVTNKSRDWQVLLKLLKLDIMSVLSDGFSYTGLHITILILLKMIIIWWTSLIKNIQVFREDDAVEAIDQATEEIDRLAIDWALAD